MKFLNILNLALGFMPVFLSTKKISSSSSSISSSSNEKDFDSKLNLDVTQSQGAYHDLKL